MVPARVGQLGVDLPMVADDSRHQQIAHPFADERGHPDEDVLVLCVSHEGERTEAGDRVFAPRAAFGGDGMEAPVQRPEGGRVAIEAANLAAGGDDVGPARARASRASLSMAWRSR